MDSHKHLQTFFFFSLFLGGVVLSFFVFKPYLYPLILAGTLAIVFFPMHKKILNWTKDRNILASLISLLIIFAIVVIPLGIFGFQVFKEAKSLYAYFASSGAGDFSESGIIMYLKEKAAEYSPLLSFDIELYAKQFVVWLVENIGPIFSEVARVVSGFLITFLSLFFFLKDGKKLRKMLFFYSPLEDKYDRKIFDTIAKTANSVVKGSLLISIIQGIIAGIGFWIFGIPNPALWAFVTVIAALIPAIGTLLTLIPAVLYLLFASSSIMALGLLLWGILIVSTVDNVLRPKIIGKDIRIHPLLIFLGVLGGVQFFGAMGFLLGPLVIGFLFSLLNIYSEIESAKSS